MSAFNRVMHLKCIYSVVCVLFLFQANAAQSLPNIVFLIADDLGIGDVGCYGNHTIRTPNIDSLANDGILLQHHLAAASICTPSRAALLTARYPARYGLVGTEGTARVIVHVASKAELPRTEVTLAHVLKQAGYATGAVGKWHLGSGCQWFGYGCVGAQNYGFDYFYGILFTLSATMDPNSSFWIFDLRHIFYQTWLVTFCVTISFIYFTFKSQLRIWLTVFSFFIYFLVWFFYTHYRMTTAGWWQVSPWMDTYMNGVIVRNGQVIRQTIVDYDSLSGDLIEESVRFINESSNSEKPFFLYHSFAHVHTPLFSDRYSKGRSHFGDYGDSVEEMDDGVGTILDALRRNAVQDFTIVYFVSDHGGSLESINLETKQRTGGFNKLFKGGKAMGAPEGAIRVPGIIRWPQRIKPGSSLNIPTSLMDIFPTILEFANLTSVDELFPNSKTLDGKSVAKFLLDPDNAKQQRRILLHHCDQSIHALRLITEWNIYKMYLYLNRWEPNSTQCGWGENVMCGCYGEDVIDVSDAPILYELNRDPYEDSPLNYNSEEYEMVVAELQSYLSDWKRQVHYQPSIFSSWLDTLLLPWLQPFKFY